MPRLEELTIEQISEALGQNLTKHYAEKELPADPPGDLLTREVREINPISTTQTGYASHASQSVKALKVCSLWYSWTRGIWVKRHATVIECVEGGRAAGEGWAESTRYFFRGDLSDQDILDYLDIISRVGTPAKVVTREL